MLRSSDSTFVPPAKLALAGILAWLAYVVLVAFYYPAGGDEPGYFWAARRLAEGDVPVLDFFVITPWATLAPYAAVIRWLSPAWEAARLISVASIAGVSLVVGVLCWRHWGAKAGVAGFALIGLSHFWFSWNVQVNHYPMANFALVAAYAVLVTGRPAGLRALLLGILVGWMVNARFPMLFAGLTIIGIAIWKGRAAGMTWGALLRGVVLPLGIGGALVSLPSFYILFRDPDGFFYDYLRFRFEFTDATFMAAESTGEKLAKVIKNRFEGLYTLFFGWFGTETKATYPNLTILGALVLGGVRAALAGQVKRVFGDERVWVAAALVGAILAAYAFADMVLPNHLQPILPLLIIVGMGLMAIPAGDSRFSRLAWVGVGLLATLTALNFMFWTASLVVRRAEPSHGRPLTVAQVGCWLERNTPPGAMVMSYNTLPVTVSGRYLPAGYDYAGNIIALFWGRIAQDKAERHKILSDRGYLALLKAGALPYVVLDQDHTYFLTPPVKPEYQPVINEIGEVIARDYRLVAHTGGPFPYRVMVRNSVAGDFPDLPRRDGLQVDLRRLFKADAAGLAGELGRDLGHSLARLPADLSASLARVGGAAFERRCPDYLRAEQTR